MTWVCESCWRETDLLFEDEDGNAICEECFMEDKLVTEIIPRFDQTAFVARDGHAPDRTVIDLDYPMYGEVVVRCEGREYNLWVVRRALALARELGGEIKEWRKSEA